MILGSASCLTTKMNWFAARVAGSVRRKRAVLIAGG
jgi:hypothetical protein